MPAEQGSWRDNGVELAKRLAAELHRQSALCPTFRIGINNPPSAEAGTERAVLGFQVLDSSRGLSFQPSGDASR